MRTLLIEDDPKALQLLQTLLAENCPTLEICGTANTTLEAIKAIQSLHPDLIFLDVELPQGSGFDVLDATTSDQFQTIFVTAFDRYLLPALRANALDFLLKPVDPVELVKAVSRAQKRSVEQASRSMHQFLDGYARRRIALPTQQGHEYIPAGSLIYAEANGSYVKLFLQGESRPRLISRKLKEVEAILAPQGFCRVSRFHLINPEYVDQYQRTDGGQVILSNGVQLAVSRNYRDQLAALLDKMTDRL